MQTGQAACAVWAGADWSLNSGTDTITFTATLSGDGASGSATYVATVSRYAFEVDVSVAPTSVTPGEMANVHAVVTSGQMWGTPFALKIRNDDTGQVVAACNNWWGTCDYQYTPPWSENANPGSHHFSAYMGNADDSDTPIDDIPETTLQVTSYPFEVSIATTSPLHVGEAGNVHAEVSHGAMWGTPYWLKIRNDDTGQIVVACYNWWNACDYGYTPPWSENANPGTHHFSAFLANPEDTEQSSNTASAVIEVLPQHFEVAASASSSTMTVGETGNIHAEITSGVMWGSPYYLKIREDQTGQIVAACYNWWNACDYGFWPSWSTPTGIHTFSVFMADPYDVEFPSDVATVSVEVKRPRYDVSIESSSTSVAVGDSGTVTARLQGGTLVGTPYALNIRDDRTEQVVAQCRAVDGTCTYVFSVDWSENAEHADRHYSAFVSTPNLSESASDIETVSIGVDPRDFELDFKANSESWNSPGLLNLRADLEEGSLAGTPLAVIIRNDDSDEILAQCANAENYCDWNLGVVWEDLKNGGDRHYSAYVGTAQYAASETKHLTISLGVPGKEPNFGEPDAGAGDPVDAVSGNFVLTKTDVSAIGIAQGVEMTRTYNSRDPKTGALGPGWSWVGSEHLIELPNGDARVLRADGKTFDFESDSSGGFDPPYGEEVSLRRSGSNFVLSDPYRSQETVYSGSGYVLTKRDENGRTRTYSWASGRLQSISSGNQSVEFDYDGGGRLSGASDSSGRSVSYVYASGRLVEVVNPEGESARFTYDESGRLKTARNPDGKLAVENTYDADGRVLSQKMGDAGPASFNYGEGETTYTDAEGGGHVVSYNQWDKPVALEGPAGSDEELTRRADGLISAIEEADGSTTAFEYDSDGRVITETDPAGHQTEYAYDQDSNLISVTDPLGRETSLTYDNEGNPTSSTNPLGKTTTFNWSGPGLLTSKTDPLGRTTIYGRDAQGRVTSVTDALGHTSSVSYSADGQVTTATDPLGRTSEFEYSPMGRTISATDPLGNTTASDYDDAGNLVTFTDPRGNETTSEFDELERPVATRVNGALVSQSGYDFNGNELWSKDGAGAESTNTFDSEGRQTSSTTPEGSTTSYEYDELGRKISEEDARGGTTEYEYDLVGNLTAVQDAEGAVTHYGYDAVGNMTSETDALGRVTAYTYNAADQLVREEKPLGLVTEYTYDDAGQLIEKDVAGEATSYTYDALGRLTGADPEVGPTRIFSYDAAGQLLSASVAGGGSTSFSYDLAGRIASTTDALGLSTTYDYDEAGNPTSMTDSSGATQIEYDAQDRPTQVITPSGREHEFTYDAAGNPTEQRAYKPAAGSRELIATTERNFDLDGQLLSQVTKDGSGSQIASLTYTYDSSGNPTRRATHSSDQQYAYDAVNRITQVEFANHTDTYAYDAVGNRTAKNGSPYIYNALGELTSSPGGVTYTYDSQGRRASRTDSSGTETYAWDSFDQLTQTAGAQTSSYAYDARGRLTSTTTGLFTRSYNYATGDSPTRINSTLTGAPTGSLAKSELLNYGPRGLLEASTGTSSTFPLADNVGTLTGAVDESGSFSAEDDLDPFGVPTGSAQTPGYDKSTLAFTGAFGRESLPYTELVRMGARQYDAGVGAFITRDPITGPADEPSRRVAYGYAFGGPGRFTDLDGRSVSDLVCKIPSLGCALRPAADRAHDYYKSVLDDPDASGLAKAAATVGRLLSSVATCENYGDSVLIAIPIPGPGKLRALEKLRRLKKAEGVAVGGRKAVEIGKAGEDAVRAAHDIGSKTRIQIPGSGRTRIPDGLTSRTLSEVKNTASLSYTQQLRDFAEYARANGLRFDLYVRTTTRLSGPLKQAIADGSIRLRYIP